MPTHVGEAGGPRRSAEKVKPDDERAASPREGAALDPVLVAALARTTTERAGALLDRIAIPRHHRAAPRGLVDVAAEVTRTLGGTYAVSRRTVRHDGAEADIVLAERPGRDPSRVVVVMAHYDAVAGTDGADDDASGTVGMLLVAEAIADVPTDATLRFVAFPFEEQGMVASTSYLASLDAAERDAIVGVYNLEMIGFSDSSVGSQQYPEGVSRLVAGRARPLPTTGDFIAAVGCPSDAEPLEALERARAYVPRLKTETIGVPRPLTLLAPDLLRSDHGPFWLAGVPAVMLTDTANFRTPHYHQPSDRRATIDVNLLVGTARWVTAAVGLLAGCSPVGAAGD